MPTLVLPFPAINPVLVQWGPLAIRWYALAYIAGLVLGWWVVRRIVAADRYLGRREAAERRKHRRPSGLLRLRRHHRRPARQRAVLRPGLLPRPPARRLQGLGRRHGLPRRPDRLLSRHDAVRMALRARRSLTVMDLCSLVAPIGLFFGRIANFIRPELWGRPTDVPWAVVFPGTDGLPRHPSQIYEALLEGRGGVRLSSMRSPGSARSGGRGSSRAPSASSTGRRAFSANSSANPIRASRTSGEG